MSASFDKFGWLKKLRADDRISDREYRLGSAICTDFTRRDGSGWMVELDALSASVPTGLSRNRLKLVLQKLIAIGYLVETDRSGSGGQRVTAKRAHDLALPIPAPAAVQVSGNTRTAGGAGIGQTRTAGGSNLHPQRFKPAPLAVQKVASDLDETPPTGTPSGTSTGTGAAHDPEPARFCPRHPGGTRDNCRPCGDHRRDHDAWQERQHGRNRADGQARRDAIAACPVCDEFGQVDLGDAVATCRHPEHSSEATA